MLISFCSLWPITISWQLAAVCLYDQSNGVSLITYMGQSDHDVYNNADMHERTNCRQDKYILDCLNPLTTK